MEVPFEKLLLLLGVESVPSIFRTVGNVTADLAATRIVGAHDRLARSEVEPDRSRSPADEV